MENNSPFSLTGKVIIQFGGTGHLGRALVNDIAGAGATLVVASRNREKLAELAAEHAAAGRTVHIEQVDIRSEESLHALRDRVLAEHGRVDGIVFNAVHRALTNSFASDLAEWQESMAVNSDGLFATTRTFGDVMAELGNGGSIVNIASHMGFVGHNPALYEGTGMKTAPDYFFHKGGMINFTRYLASHYGPSRVRANVVSPGGIYNHTNPQPEPFLSRYNTSTMLGRMAEPEEIGGAVVFLLSEASSYVTATNLVVDGGYSAK